MELESIKNRQPVVSAQRIHLRFKDVEALQEAARHWDLDFRQLDGGPFDGEVHVVTMPEIHLGHVRFDRLIEQAGAPPAGLRTLGVPARSEFRMFWRGRPVSGGDVVVYPRGSEIDAISQPGFEIYPLSFSPRILQAAGEALGIRDLERILDASDVVAVDRRRLAALRRDLATWFSGAMSPATARWARETLPLDLVGLLVGAPPSRPRAPACLMDQTIQMTRDLVAAHPHDALRVGDLCGYLDVSDRTLRHAFRNRLGMTPKAYVRDRRLNLVRQVLRQNKRSATRIADVANHHGFWHMGQFAADYRRLFGELPSETLSQVGAALPSPHHGAS